MPADARLKTDSHVFFNESQTSTTYTDLEFTIPQVLARDIHFNYEKTSFPKLSDAGVLDLNLENIHAKIALTLMPMLDGKTDVELFRIEDISYKIGSVSFKTDETKHSFLYGLLHPIIKSQIKANT